MVKALKLKGDDTKKKKKSSKSKLGKDPEHLLQGSHEAHDAIASSSKASVEDVPEDKTEAEKRFEAEQLKRLAAKVAREAKKSHKERVAEFNAKLEALSEHHDIPKVGPG